MLNLTPHTIVVISQGREIVIAPSGRVARVQAQEVLLGSMDVCSSGVPECDEQGNTNGHRVPIVSRVLGEPEGLPEEGTPCLVSSIVLAAVPGRRGVYAPDTGPTAVRDGEGRIVAVTRLIAA